MMIFCKFIISLSFFVICASGFSVGYFDIPEHEIEDWTKFSAWLLEIAPDKTFSTQVVDNLDDIYSMDFVVTTATVGLCMQSDMPSFSPLLVSDRMRATTIFNSKGNDINEYSSLTIGAVGLKDMFDKVFAIKEIKEIFELEWSVLAKSISFFFDAQSVIKAVQAGDLDIGIVPACSLESMAQQGLISLSSFTIISEKYDDSLACKHSTEETKGTVLMVNPYIEDDKLIKTIVTEGLALDNRHSFMIATQTSEFSVGFYDPDLSNTMRSAGFIIDHPELPQRLTCKHDYFENIVKSNFLTLCPDNGISRQITTLGTDDTRITVGSCAFDDATRNACANTESCYCQLCPSESSSSVFSSLDVGLLIALGLACLLLVCAGGMQIKAITRKTILKFSRVTKSATSEVMSYTQVVIIDDTGGILYASKGWNTKYMFDRIPKGVQLQTLVSQLDRDRFSEFVSECFSGVQDINHCSAIRTVSNGEGYNFKVDIEAKLITLINFGKCLIMVEVGCPDGRTGLEIAQRIVMGFHRDNVERITFTTHEARIKLMSIMGSMYRLRNMMKRNAVATNCRNCESIKHEAEMACISMEKEMQSVYNSSQWLLGGFKMRMSEAPSLRYRIDLRTFVRNIVERFQSLTKVQIKSQFDDTIYRFICTDGSKLEQIISKLLVNGVRLSGGTPIVLRTKTSSEGDFVTFDVIHQGRGISKKLPEQYLQDMWFWSSEQLQETKVSDLLMLLDVPMLVRAARQIGGDIGFIEDSTERYVDYVSIPIDRKPLVPGSQTTQNFSHLHVIVVDTQDSCTVLQDIIRGFGCSCESIIAEKGKPPINHHVISDKMDAYLSGEVSKDMGVLLLMNVSLNSLHDGFNIVHMMRKNKYDFPVIALSATACSDDLEYYAKDGFDAVIPIPFTMHQLKQLLLHFLMYLVPDKQQNTPDISPVLSASSSTITPGGGTLYEEDMSILTGEPNPVHNPNHALVFSPNANPISASTSTSSVGRLPTRSRFSQSSVSTDAMSLFEPRSPASQSKNNLHSPPTATSQSHSLSPTNRTPPPYGSNARRFRFPEQSSQLANGASSDSDGVFPPPPRSILVSSPSYVASPPQSPLSASSTRRPLPPSLRSRQQQTQQSTITSPSRKLGFEQNLGLFSPDIDTVGDEGQLQTLSSSSRGSTAMFNGMRPHKTQSLFEPDVNRNGNDAMLSKGRMTRASMNVTPSQQSQAWAKDIVKTIHRQTSSDPTKPNHFSTELPGDHLLHPLSALSLQFSDPSKRAQCFQRIIHSRGGAVGGNVKLTPFRNSDKHFISQLFEDIRKTTESRKPPKRRRRDKSHRNIYQSQDIGTINTANSTSNTNHNYDSMSNFTIGSDGGGQSFAAVPMIFSALSYTGPRTRKRTVPPPPNNNTTMITPSSPTPSGSNNNVINIASPNNNNNNNNNNSNHNSNNNNNTNIDDTNNGDNDNDNPLNTNDIDLTSDTDYRGRLDDSVARDLGSPLMTFESTGGGNGTDVEKSHDDIMKELVNHGIGDLFDDMKDSETKTSNK